MSKPPSEDYTKPYYINSFRADEIIFNRVRGTAVRAKKYDSSFPVSLDAQKIRNLSSQKRYKEQFGKEIFRETKSMRSFKKKIYSDAIINVDFSADHKFTDVALIDSDYDDFQKSGSLSRDVIDHMDIDLVEEYKTFLELYGKNQEARKASKAWSKPITEECDLDIGKGYRLVKVRSSVKKTRIRISADLCGNEDAAKDTPVLRFCFTKADAGENRILAVGEFDEDILVKKNKAASVKLDFDIRELMEKEENKENEKRSVYILEEGSYVLHFLGTENRSFPAA